MGQTADGKTELWNVETGERVERHPIDARGMIASGEYSPEPVAAKAPASESDDELDGLSKDELVALADEQGLTVTREDGEDGAPLKGDYLRALRAAE